MKPNLHDERPSSGRLEQRLSCLAGDGTHALAYACGESPARCALLAAHHGLRPDPSARPPLHARICEAVNLDMASPTYFSAPRAKFFGCLFKGEHELN